jgi:hypothetical protein
MPASETWLLHTTYDYGQFYLQPAPIAGLDMNQFQLAKLDGIGEIDNVLFICSPAQRNWNLTVDIERWEQEPIDDLEGWQEAFEASMMLGQGGLSWSTVDFEDPPIPVPAGDYRIRICGRGFAHPPVENGDTWRLQLWPESERIAPRQLRRYSG